MEEEKIVNITKELKPEINKLGVWLSDLFGPISELSGILSSELRFYRVKRLFDLKLKFDNYLKIKGPKTILKKIPLTFGIQLLENASLEDNDELHSMWARLLANVVDPKSKVKPNKSYVDILRQLGFEDALLLRAIYAEYKKNDKAFVFTSKWPERLFSSEKEEEEEYKNDPNEEVCERVMNLLRLGLISTALYFGGGPCYSRVNLTVLGVNFVKACEEI